MRPVPIPACVLAAWVALGSDASAQESARAVPGPIGDVEFRTLHARLCPAQESPWQRVPWQTDLLEARRRAVASGRPMFMWSMNGHPLGCT